MMQKPSGDIFAGHKLIQFFRCESDGLSNLSIGVIPHAAARQISLELYSVETRSADGRSVSPHEIDNITTVYKTTGDTGAVDADGRLGFHFPPLPHSQGQVFAVKVESGETAENAVTVWLDSDAQRIPGHQFCIFDGGAQGEFGIVARAGFSEPAAGRLAVTSESEPQSALLELLAKQCVGLRPVASNDILISADGQHLELMSSDPWLILELAPEPGGHPNFGVLTIETGSVVEERELMGKVYIDRGVGYQEDHCLHYPRAKNETPKIIVSPGMIHTIRWDPDESCNTIKLPTITYKSIHNQNTLESIIIETIPTKLEQDENINVSRLISNAHTITIEEANHATTKLAGLPIWKNYSRWKPLYSDIPEGDYSLIASESKNLKYKPLLSVIIPTYNTNHDVLRACLDSIISQAYQNYEICISDDCSSDPGVVEILAEYAARDSRVKFIQRTTNGHISAASNSALTLATGDFIVLMDHDDLIPNYALFMVAWFLNQYPQADIIYSDEDKLSTSGDYYEPYFKGCLNKFLMYGCNMVSHLGVYRRSLVEAVGGFRKGFEGAQDYDLFLRCYEHSADDRIVHIPHVLYHWRAISGSTSVSVDQKSYAFEAAKAAINGHFERTNMPFHAVDGYIEGVSAIVPTREFDTPVSIIIPTRNGLDILKPCVDSILAAPHQGVEILIVDNDSDDQATLDYMNELQTDGVAKIIRYPHPFNYSAINNYAAESGSGEILCFLNNDTEVIASGWLSRARALLSLDEVGAVGAKLLYPDGTLQHFGVVTGLGDHGVAAHIHGRIDGRASGYFGKARMIQEFTAVTAACMFMRKETFLAVGGFEPELAVAYNDVDLCLKVRKLGLRIVGDPEIELIHKESKTRGDDLADKEKRARLDRDAAWMIKRWTAEYLLNDPYYSPNHALDRADFAMATPPRVLPPWRQNPAVAAKTTKKAPVKRPKVQSPKARAKKAPTKKP